MARVNVGSRRRVTSRRQALAVATLFAVVAGALVVASTRSRAVRRSGDLEAGPRTTWQWQITGRVDEGVKAAMYEIDLFYARPGQVNAG